MLGKLGVLTNDARLDAEFRIHFEQTNFHGRSKHDASISRLDLGQSNNAVVDPALVQYFMDDTIPRFYPYSNTSSVARTRLRRQCESRRAENLQLNQVFFDSA
jgi:hypothetical protein